MSKTDGRGFLPPNPMTKPQSRRLAVMISLTWRTGISTPVTGVAADTLVTLRQRFEAPANTTFVLLLFQLILSPSTEHIVCAVLKENVSPQSS